MRRALLAAVLLAAAAPQPAPAAWSPPAPVSPPAPALTDVAIGFDRDGRGLVSWNQPDATARTRSVGADGSLGGLGAHAGTSAGPPVLFGGGAALLLARPTCRSGLGARCTASDRDTRVTLALALRRGGAGGLPRTARVLDRFTGLGGAALAGNARGRLAVVYSDLGGTRERPAGATLWLAEARPSQPFGRPRAIARGRGIGAATVAVGARGELLVVYERGDRVVARVRRRPDDGLGRPDDLGPTRAVRLQLQALFGSTGDAVVAWERTAIAPNPGIPPVITTVQAATRPATTARFGNARTLARGEHVEGGARLAADGRGRVTLAFNGAVGVEVRRTNPSGRLPAAPLPVVAMRMIGLAAGADGTTAIVGTGVATRIGEIVAALGAPGGAFGTPETVVTQSAAGAASVAFDQRTGEPVVVWVHGVGDNAAELLLATRTSCQDSDCG